MSEFHSGITNNTYHPRQVASPRTDTGVWHQMSVLVPNG